MLSSNILLAIFISTVGSTTVEELKNQGIVQISENLTEIHEEIDFSSTEDHIVTLIGNLINRTDPATIGFIIDSIYYEHISHQDFIATLGRSQTFVLPIQDYEVFDDRDGRPEQERVQEMLSAMKAVYCDFYVILITNGIQMKTLLRYIDNHRLLNVIAKLVVLHDYRILTPDMNYIWKRFVNVVFIRRCYTRGVWYELSTVPFPAKIEEVMLTRIVNYWTPENRYRWRRDTFEKKHEKSLAGETLKVIVLPHTPSVYKKYFNKNGTAQAVYSGLEIDLLEVLSVSMNFSVEYYDTPDSERVKWGQQVDDQNYTGLLGEMDQANADIALGDLHYTTFHLKVMDLSVPYNTECLTFITPELLSDNSWQTLVSPFSLGMWIGVFLSLSCVGVIFFLFSKCYVIIKPSDVAAERNSYFGRDFFDDFSSCIIYTYSMVLLVSLPRLPLRWSVRVLTGWWWIYCVLLVVAYRAALTSILANPTSRVTIDTIQVLANSWLKCGAWGEQNMNFFTQADDEAAQKIGQKMEHADDSEAAIKKVALGDFAFYESRFALQQLRFDHEEKQDESAQSLHIMEQCAFVVPVSIGLDKNSPLKHRMDSLILRLVEAGLVQKWLTEAMMSFKSSIEEPPAEAVMNFGKFYSGLVVLGVGYTLALLAFAAEKAYFKFVVEANPNYDRFYGKIITG